MRLESTLGGSFIEPTLGCFSRHLLRKFLGLRGEGWTSHLHGPWSRVGSLVGITRMSPIGPNPDLGVTASYMTGRA